MIEDNAVNTGGIHAQADLVYLPGANQGSGIERGPALQNFLYDFGSGAIGEHTKLGKGLLGGGSRGVVFCGIWNVDTDNERAFLHAVDS
jgi:hypothetical protein